MFKIRRICVRLQEDSIKEDLDMPKTISFGWVSDSVGHEALRVVRGWPD